MISRLLLIAVLASASSISVRAVTCEDCASAQTSCQSYCDQNAVSNCLASVESAYWTCMGAAEARAHLINAAKG
jgi:hypothetical protein